MTKQSPANTNGHTSGAYRVEDLPPQNLLAENCVLGSCLIDPSAIDEVSQTLEARQFYSDANRIVFACLCDMQAKDQKIDAVTIAAELERRGKLAEIGGPARHMDLMDAVPHSAHAVSYAAEVVDAARRRDALIAGMGLVRDARSKSIPTDELLSSAETAIHATMENSSTNRSIAIGDVLEDVLRNLKSGGESRSYLPTGMDRLDSLAEGLPMGGMTILAARPGMGKTAIAGSLTVQSAEAGAKIVFYSYEQRPMELAQRLLAIVSGISYHALSRQNLGDETCQKIMTAAGKLQRLKIELDCNCRTQSSLVTSIRLQARRGMQLGIVDYLQLIEPDDRRAVREQQVAGITRSLKRVAMACDVPLLVLSQLNREVEKRADQRPKLSDLRESGAIEQDADQVWLLHRPGAYQGDRQDREGRALPPIPDDFGILEIAKNRNGPRGEVKLVWEPATMSYSADVQDPFRGKF